MTNFRWMNILKPENMAWNAFSILLFVCSNRVLNFPNQISTDPAKTIQTLVIDFHLKIIKFLDSSCE